jgi:hypothetical protein
LAVNTGCAGRFADQESAPLVSAATPPPARLRWTIVTLAVVAAAAFALSVQGGRWWSSQSFEVGPFGSRDCLGGTCHSTGLAWLGGSEVWMRAGNATWAGGLMSMLLLLVMAARVAAGGVPRLAAKTSLVAIATATATAVAFVVGFPRMGGLHVDRGIFLFGIGLGFGSAAAVLVLRSHLDSDE